MTVCPAGMGDRVLDSGSLIVVGAGPQIDWCIVRAPMHDAINGYVRLPEGHPWLDLDLTQDDTGAGPRVHGGVTYQAGRWVGFDTLHAFCRDGGCRCTYWTQEMVIEETKALAFQASIAVISNATP